ncbi:MAG: hypothetical protein GY850_22285, partial [bacterium]|nr:hypothetical protein [bacterium]
MSVQLPLDRVFDPGPGGVAVMMKGGRPQIISLPTDVGFFYSEKKIMEAAGIILPPHGATQLSGPVRNVDGKIAVAVEINNNWDIWTYDAGWQQITVSPSIEMDPWWEKRGLVFVSDISGKFQVHAADMKQLTNES